jgi:hypothetical protein
LVDNKKIQKTYFFSIFGNKIKYSFEKTVTNIILGCASNSFQIIGGIIPQGFECAKV